MCATSGCKLPKLSGNVVVLGAGDTAFDCATSALRCGADRVYVAFRKGIQGMRAVPEEVELAIEEKCEFLPFMQVQSVTLNEATGKVRLVEFARTEQDLEGNWTTDTEQTSAIKADHVISAFGSQLTNPEMIAALDGVDLDKWGCPITNDETQRTSLDGVWCAGDIAGVAQTTVEATNDGKVGKYSKRRRSNLAVIFDKIVFICSFFFYRLLLNHSFQTNPNRITNCFELFSLITTLQLHCSCFAILIFEQPPGTYIAVCKKVLPL